MAMGEGELSQDHSKEDRNKCNDGVQMDKTMERERRRREQTALRSTPRYIDRRGRCYIENRLYWEIQQQQHIIHEYQETFKSSLQHQNSFTSTSRT
ncbi:hypothetical protein Pcinc_028939 [Petrolisthes cinctipes]|uniref:Uncharacterized protein n=1 Tax=Petrolisthes cinctipes TaxID=88211 RepID=A0AAE1F1W3_PETCI|nr:hypothetical protein Pcinc_028939 [Petrolisthes cinctipes]